MPFSRPTLSTIIDRGDTDVQSRLPGTNPRLRRNVLGILVRVFSGLTHGLYGYLDWLARQLMPDTAEAEHLERWSEIWELSRNPAAAATGNVDFTGSNGAVIPAGTTLVRSDSAEFTTDAEVTIAAGVATAAVTAGAAGAAGNTVASVTLEFASPIAGVDTPGTVDSDGLSGGADQETDAALRARLLERLAQTPHGGADFDYITWAKEVSGVTRAWAYELAMGAGTVVVRFVRDNDASIIPDAGEVTTVQDYIDARRPVTADVTVAAPTGVAFDVEISGLNPNTTAVRTAVEASIADLLRREAEPEGGSGEGTILVSHLREAISIAAGEHDHTLVSPTANVTHSTGEMAIMGTVTWS